jgi:hypothetical protein
MLFRFTLYINGNPVVGAWRKYDAELFQQECAIWADNKVAFMAEFDE